MNDVADRCDEVVDLLHKAFSEYERWLRSGKLESLGSMEEILMTGPD
ncbi:MAG: hypothetical protein ABIP48_23815 [Planctomycetota bacterium]